MNRILTIVILCLSSFTVLAQKTVSGIVNDTDGNPIIGVTVVEKGTTNGTSTDISGKYNLKVGEGAVLVFDFIGMETLEIQVREASTYSPVLAESVQLLEETVVVGYTTKKRRDLTGAVTVITVEDVQKSPYSNVVQALQSRVSGVIGTQDGQPGSGRNQLRIRGITTLNENAPLYVIDGVASVEPPTNINTNDIESIQVLKDAASASIYGSRSAGGVIIITTKKGKKDQLNVEAGVLTGVQTLANKIDLLDASQWGEVYWTASQNAGITPNHPLYGSGTVPVINPDPFLIPNQRQIYQLTEAGTNWYDEVYHNAFQQQYYLNLSNGNDRGRVAFGASYYDQDGLIKRTNYERITGRLNSSYKVLDWIEIGENLSVGYSNSVNIGTQQGQDGIPLDVIRQHPIHPVYDFLGAYAGRIEGMPDVRNMVSVLDKNQNNTSHSYRIFGNGYAQANLLDAIGSLSEKHDLIAKSSFAIDYSDFLNKRFDAKFSEGDYDVQNNTLSRAYGRGLTKTFTNTLEYGLNLKQQSVKMIGGMETVRYDFEDIGGSRTGFDIESNDFVVLSAGSGEQTNFGSGTSYGLLSYFSQVDYSFMDRYLVSGVLRYDRTSRFSDGGIFPAVSVGWRISDEPFMTSLTENDMLSDLKLRASYGEQGNQNTGNFATISTFGPDVNHADYDIEGTNNDVSQGIIVTNRGNPNLRWETTKQTNVGFDAALLDYKLTLSADFYIKNTEDILLPAPQLAAVGEGGFPVVNSATVRNTGVDVELGYKHYFSALGLRLNGEFIFNHFTNKVVNLGNNIGQEGNDGELYIDGGDGPTRIAIGYPIGTFYGHEADGLFNSAAEVDAHAEQEGAAPGRIRYSDLNGDGIIGPEDRTYIGNPYPDFTLGLNLGAEYKNITLSTFLAASIGQDVYNEIKLYTDFTQFGNFNSSTAILDAWSPENTSATIPAPTLENDNNENRPSSYYVEKASFLKMRTLKLGYNVPKKWTGGLGVNIYGQIENAFVWSGYSGIDPEVTYAGNSNFPGIDRGVYPLPRTYLLGLTLNFNR